MPITQAVMGELRGLDSELDLMSQAIADRLGVNRTDARCLDLIHEVGSMTPSQLAERMGLTAGAITTVLDRLERGRWIVRGHDTVDRRRVLVRNNEAMGGIVHPLYRDLQSATRRALSAYSDAELQLILEFLRRTRSIVANHTRRVRTTTRRAAG